MPSLKVGTFNLNNLFSRFNFEADISTAATSTVETKTTFTFDDPAGFKLRKYVKEKPAVERKLIADRIKRMDLDVLAVQEVEDIDTLRQFVREDLKGLYLHSVLIEGNDPRSNAPRTQTHDPATIRRTSSAYDVRSDQSKSGRR